MFLEHSGLYWLIIGVALALLELVVPGVVLVFFGFGALVVAVVATFFPQLAIFWQLLLFLLSSLLSLVLLRGVVLRRFLAPPEEDSVGVEGEDIAHASPGDRATVTVAITPPAAGQVKYAGTFWSAVAAEPLEAGEVVSIVRQENLMMRVERWRGKEPVEAAGPASAVKKSETEGELP